MPTRYAHSSGHLVTSYLRLAYDLVVVISQTSHFEHHAILSLFNFKDMNQCPLYFSAIQTVDRVLTVHCLYDIKILSSNQPVSYQTFDRLGCLARLVSVDRHKDNHLYSIVFGVLFSVSSLCHHDVI